MIIYNYPISQSCELQIAMIDMYKGVWYQSYGSRCPLIIMLILEFEGFNTR